jgi:cytochrome c oxidase subunit 1
MVFFVLTAALSGTLQLIDTTANRCKRYGLWFYEYDFILAVLLSSVIMIASLFAEAGPANSGWTIYPP